MSEIPMEGEIPESDKAENLIRTGDKFFYTSDGGHLREATLVSYAAQGGKLAADYILSEGEGVRMAKKHLDDLLRGEPRDEEGKPMHFAVNVQRSSGKVEGGWQYAGSIEVPDGVPMARVIKDEIEDGKLLRSEKIVPQSDLIGWNVKPKD